MIKKELDTARSRGRIMQVASLFANLRRQVASKISSRCLHRHHGQQDQHESSDNNMKKRTNERTSNRIQLYDESV
jgi:hypothetical protein